MAGGHRPLSGKCETLPIQSRRLRLLFVADDIPTELQAIIEFLNEQMDRTEVLGVEIRQYLGSDLQTLVPRVVGMTVKARSAKSTGDPRNYDERLGGGADSVRELDTLIRELATSLSLKTTTSKAARQLRASWGTVFQLNVTTGRVEFALQPLHKAGFERDADRLQAKLEDLAGQNLTAAYPTVDAVTLVDNWERLLAEFLPDYLEVGNRAWA